MSKPILKRFFDLFKTKYRLIKQNKCWKYRIQKKVWYRFGWIDIKGSDSLVITKEDFQLIINGPLVIQTSFDMHIDNEVY